MGSNSMSFQFKSSVTDQLYDQINCIVIKTAYTFGEFQIDTIITSG